MLGGWIIGPGGATLTHHAAHQLACGPMGVHYVGVHYFCQTIAPVLSEGTTVLDDLLVAPDIVSEVQSCKMGGSAIRPCYGFE